MIEHRAPQGSQEWKKARAGVITASRFQTILSKVNGLTEQQAKYVAAVQSGMTPAAAAAAAEYKTAPKSKTVDRALAGLPVGEFSDVAKNLAFRLAIERISGEPLDEGYTGWQAERGHELEPFARAAHEDRVRDMVREVGFVTDDDSWFGASADGFRVSNGSGCEYKCFLDPEKLRAVLLDGDTSDVIAQCQGGMWLTGATEWEFGLYCPALAPVGREFTLIVIKRDEDYIDAMESVLIEFRALVMHYEARLRASPDAAPPWDEPASAPAPAAAPPAAPVAGTEIPEAAF